MSQKFQVWKSMGPKHLLHLFFATWTLHTTSAFQVASRKEPVSQGISYKPVASQPFRPLRRRQKIITSDGSKKQKGRKLFIGWKWQLDLKVSTNSGMMGSRFFVSYVYLRLGVFMLLHNGRVATSAIQGTGTPRQAWHGKSRTWSLTKGHLCGVYKLSCWWSNKPPIWIDALYMANLWQMIPPIWIDTNHMDWSFTNW